MQKLGILTKLEKTLNIGRYLVSVDPQSPRYQDQDWD